PKRPRPTAVSAANCTTKASWVGSRGPGLLGCGTCASSVSGVVKTNGIYSGGQREVLSQITAFSQFSHSFRIPSAPRRREAAMAAGPQFCFDSYRLEVGNAQLWCGTRALHLKTKA